MKQVKKRFWWRAKFRYEREEENKWGMKTYRPHGVGFCQLQNHVPICWLGFVTKYLHIQCDHESRPSPALYVLKYNRSQVRWKVVTKRLQGKTTVDNRHAKDKQTPRQKKFFFFFFFLNKNKKLITSVSE